MGGAAAPDGATGKGEGLSGVAARAGPEANAAGSRWEALDDKIKQFVDLSYHRTTARAERRRRAYAIGGASARRQRRMATGRAR